VIPWLIFAVIVVPLCIAAFARARATNQAVEGLADADPATRAATEAQFADAESYQEQWREEHHAELERKRMP
jgi:hypothetical protein